VDRSSRDAAALRLREALELYVVGVDIMRQNLRRRHPALADEEIERLLGNWVRERPGAEDGDAEGRVISLDPVPR
jgi:hypothetical protein